jgi:hypothetical protein
MQIIRTACSDFHLTETRVDNKLVAVGKKECCKLSVFYYISSFEKKLNQVDMLDSEIRILQITACKCLGDLIP